MEEDQQEKVGSPKDMMSGLTVASLMSRTDDGGNCQCIDCGQFKAHATYYALVDELIPGNLFCPECRKNHEDAEERERIWRKGIKVLLRHHHIEKILRLVGVPPIYLSCSLENFQPHPPDRRPSFITGPAGVGKTHLAVAYLREDILLNSSKPKFLRTVDLFKRLRVCFKEKYSEESEQDILQEYGGTSFLVLDDLGAEKGTDFVVQTLYDLIDTRYGGMLPTLITSNLSLEGLAQPYGSHGDRLASRIAGMGPTLTLRGKDRRWQR